MSVAAANVNDQPGLSIEPDQPIRSARVLAVFLPITVILLLLGEMLTPNGLDKPTTTLAAALRALQIGRAHSAQLYLANMLVIFGLGALGVSFAAIATLARRRDAVLSVAAAVIGGLAAFCGALANMLVGFNVATAATAHTSPAAGARVLVSADTSAVSTMLLVVYLGGGLTAIVLTAIALWRSATVTRWLALLFGVGLVFAAASRPGIVALPLQLPFAVAMFVLATRIWNDPHTTHKQPDHPHA